LERVEILRDLRLGVYDVVVGINLLREGLDLPEVTLVAILDADKQGFLRSQSALIQTMGRAARHVEGRAILYADRMTEAMENAIGETDRRRQIQEAHNREHGIEPRSIVKSIRDLTDRMKVMAEDQADYSIEDGGDARAVYLPALSPDELVKKIAALEEEMQEAAQMLEFERAASLRDEVIELRQALKLERV
jgi:excinuclease ABC subunit B